MEFLFVTKVTPNSTASKIIINIGGEDLVVAVYTRKGWLFKDTLKINMF